MRWMSEHETGIVIDPKRERGLINLKHGMI